MSTATPMAQTQGYTIAEAVRATGASADTLRYYEKAGVMPPVERDSGGRRRYSRDDLGWVVFVLRLRATGMPLGEIATYARMVRRGEGTVPQRRALLEGHLTTVRAAIEELRAAERMLTDKIEHYAATERGEELACHTTALDVAARIG